VVNNPDLSRILDLLQKTELPSFSFYSAELRYFPDMSRYLRAPEWPRYHFAPV